MKITLKDLDELNAYFQKWQGTNACLNSYVDTEDRLIIAFERPGKAREHIGTCFLQCVFLPGPTRWSKSDLGCKLYDMVNGDEDLKFKTQEVVLS